MMVVFSNEFGSDDPFRDAIECGRWMIEHDAHSFRPHIGIASVTIADMDLQGVIVTRGDLRVENSTLWSVFLQQGESIDISDSIVGAGVGVLHAFSVGEGTTRRMVIVRLDRNVLMAGTGTAVNLLAFTDARITAILHDNVVMGPVNTYGNVTIAGDQR